MDAWLYWTISVGLLVAGFIIGLVGSTHFLHFLKPSIEHIQQLATQIHQHGSIGLAILTVFWNNTRVALLMMGLGTFAGVFPVFTLWSNGVMMGVVTQLVATKVHVPVWKVLLFGELPHGVFELTALCWASAIGIRLGVTAVDSVWSMLAVKHHAGSLAETPRSAIAPAGSRRENGSGRENGRRYENDRTFRSAIVHALERLPVIVAILLVAACVEITVTPHLIHLYQPSAH